MKKLLLALTITAASFTANAEDNKQSRAEYCEAASALAGAVMDSRQNGVLMSEQYKIAAGDKMLELLIKEAYERPAFGTAEYKDKSTAEFSDEVFLACIKG